MIKLKKFLFIFGCSLALLMGCSNGNETVESNNGNETGETTEPKYQKEIIENKKNNKGAYCIKFNNSKNVLSENEVGNFNVKFKSNNTTVNRLVFQDNNNNIGLNNKSAENFYQYYYNDTSIIRKKTDEVMKNALSDTNWSNKNKVLFSNTNTENTELEVNATKKFWIFDNNNNDIEQEAVLKFKNEVCNVWFINNASGKVTDEDIDFEEFADKFYSIYELNCEIMGTHKYGSPKFSNIINSKDKIDIIVNDIFFDSNDNNKTATTVGYFYSNDSITNEYLEKKKPNYHSNETQCIYIDSVILKERPTLVYSTLVHEFTHLLNYCQKICVQGNKTMDTWYTEMLAMLSEDMFYEKLCKDSNLLENSDNPIYQDFLNRIFLFGTNYNYGFTDIWDSEIYVKNPLIAYGNTYAYGAYLVRNKGGFELLKDIAQNEFINEQAIDEAIRKISQKYPKLHPEIEDFKTSALYLSQGILDCFISGFDDPISFDIENSMEYGNTVLSFRPIDIRTSFTQQDGTKIYSPIRFDYNDKVPLRGYSCSIHYIENFESIEFNFDNNSPLELYWVFIN